MNVITRAESGDLDDMWAGLARPLPLAEVVRTVREEPQLGLRDLVVVHPSNEGLYLKATVPLRSALSSDLSVEAVRAEVQRQVGNSLHRDTGPASDTGARRLEGQDIPIGALRVAGSTDDIVRFVTKHRCDMHSLQWGGSSTSPILSREVDPS